MKNLSAYIILFFCLVITNSYANDATMSDNSSCATSATIEVLADTLSLLDSHDEILEIDLHLRDHKFFPKTIQIPSQRKVRLTIYNNDPTIEEFESHDLKREKVILAKSHTVIILAPLKKGIYKFFGEFHEDTAQGELIVEDVVK
jgi:hypothetical protein